MSERIYKEAWEYTMKVLHDLYKSQNKEDEFNDEFSEFISGKKKNKDKDDSLGL